MRIALYQPDIPQNLGTNLRTAACFNVPVEIIGPCGFIMDDKKIRRAGMDYIDHVHYNYHSSWERFCKWRHDDHANARVILLSSKAQNSYTDFQYQENDILIAGRETAGVPDEVVHYVDYSVKIPMQQSMRSLNVAISVAIVLSEAARQLKK